MWLFAGGLIVVGALLTGPVSFRLAGAGWTRRSPRPALVLWQAVCLTAGFSVVAGLVLLAVEPLGNTLIGAAWNWFAAMLTGSLQVPVWRLVCGLAAASISLGLLAVVARTAVLTVRRRHAHRQVLDLLTQPPARSGRSRLAATSEVRILDARAAVAYTLPGWHSRVVLSAGLVDLLTEPELTAVVEHEQAHLRARHDLLVLPFQAWAVALGWIPGVRPAGSSVAELTEMLADDVAAATNLALEFGLRAGQGRIVRHLRRRSPPTSAPPTSPPPTSPQPTSPQEKTLPRPGRALGAIRRRLSVPPSPAPQSPTEFDACLIRGRWPCPARRLLWCTSRRCCCCSSPRVCCCCTGRDRAGSSERGKERSNGQPDHRQKQQRK